MLKCRAVNRQLVVESGRPCHDYHRRIDRGERDSSSLLLLSWRLLVFAAQSILSAEVKYKFAGPT